MPYIPLLQIKRLIEASGWGPEEFVSLAAGGRSLLDIGAGDGNVTATAFAPLLGGPETARIVTTEVSAPMCKRLRDRGYECYETFDIGECAELDSMRAPPVLCGECDAAPSPQANAAAAEDAESEGGKFDVIALMNVLDRADKPVKLLQDIKALVRPRSGRVVISVVPHCLTASLSASVPHCLPHCLPRCLSHRLSHCLPQRLRHCLSHRLSHCLAHCLTVCLTVCLNVCIIVCLTVCLTIRLTICLTVCLTIRLTICPAGCAAVLPVC